jgi:membrane protein YdbS with pleckstrin-like domain
VVNILWVNLLSLVYTTAMAKIYCSNCGHMIPENVNFCFKCGAAQHGSESAVYRAGNPVVDHPTAPVQEVTVAKAATSTANYIPKRKLCKEVKAAFILGYLGKTSILLPLLLLGVFFEPVIFTAAIALYVVVIFLTANLSYDNYYFTIDETGFQKEYGIIHKNQVSIPYHQIQNVNIVRTLLDRMLGLSRIHIETAGGSNGVAKEIAGGSTTKAEAHLPGVTLTLAKEVHDLLLQKANEAKN